MRFGKLNRPSDAIDGATDAWIKPNKPRPKPRLCSQHGIQGHSLRLPPVSVEGGVIQVFVRGVSATGETGRWSDRLQFGVPPVDTLIIPAAPTIFWIRTYDGAPNLTWSAESNASVYEVVIYDKMAGKEVLHEAELPSNHLSLNATFETGTLLQIFVRGISRWGRAGEWSRPVETVYVPQDWNYELWTDAGPGF